MGAAAGVVVQALSCKDCAKYVCNSMDIKSECSDCCSLEIETHEVPLETSETDLEVEGCFEFKHK